MKHYKKFFSLFLATAIPLLSVMACANTATTASTTATTNTTASSTAVATIDEHGHDYEHDTPTETSVGEVTDPSSTGLNTIANPEIEPFDYSEGIDAQGLWQGITAKDYVTLPDYKNISIPPTVHEIGDEAVQSQIDLLLQQFTTSKQVTDRAIVDGDTVNIDYVGSVDGKEFEGGSTGGSGTDVTIGVTQYIDDFLEQLIGHKPGESFDIKVTFPEDYGVEDLNGKEATFAITVNHISEQVKPELDDAFVQTNFSTYGWKTVEDMKNQIKSDLQKQAIFSFVQEYLVNNTEVKEIPALLTDYQENSMLSYYQNQATAYGMTFEQLLPMVEGVTSKEDLITKYVERNTQAATFNLAVQAVAEDADLSVNDEDLAAYFKDEMKVDDHTSYETQYGKPYLMQVTLIQKVMNYLIENAKLA